MIDQLIKPFSADQFYWWTEWSDKLPLQIAYVSLDCNVFKTIYLLRFSGGNTGGLFPVQGGHVRAQSPSRRHLRQHLLRQPGVLLLVDDLPLVDQPPQLCPFLHHSCHGIIF